MFPVMSSSQQNEGNKSENRLLYVMECYDHCREARRKCWEYTGKVGITLPRSDSEATGFVFHDKVMKKH